jgi:hypothetical protein
MTTTTTAQPAEPADDVQPLRQPLRYDLPRLPLPWRHEPEPSRSQRAGVDRLAAGLDYAAERLHPADVRDQLCTWLSRHGLLHRRDRDSLRLDALDRAGRLAHDDTGHAGRLDMCDVDLCRALSEAGAC